MSTYLYGIVAIAAPPPAPRTSKTKNRKNARGRSAGRAGERGNEAQAASQLELPATGVGNPPAPVRLVRYRTLAAVASDVPADYHAEVEGLRGMRRDMRAHAAVLNHLARSTTVLPFRFGVVLPDDEAVIGRILRRQFKHLSDYLQALAGSVEVTLRATSLEDEALREVIARRPQLAGTGRRGGGGSMAQEARIELGRQLAAGIEELQERDARWILSALAPAARDVRVGRRLRDLMALNASFLVERDNLAKFDRALAKLQAKAGHRLQFDCVGPLAPYSFVDLRL